MYDLETDFGDHLVEGWQIHITSWVWVERDSEWELGQTPQEMVLIYVKDGLVCLCSFYRSFLKLVSQ